MTEVFCNNCGHRNVEGSNFCSSCGQPLERADDAMYQAKRHGGSACRFSLLNLPTD